jgi:hypothetical protein
MGVRFLTVGEGRCEYGMREDRINPVWCWVKLEDQHELTVIVMGR